MRKKDEAIRAINKALGHLNEACGDEYINHDAQVGHTIQVLLTLRGRLRGVPAFTVHTPEEEA